VRIVLVTAPAAVADGIAEALVAARVAACVSRVDGVRSVYRWRGAVERADEVQLVVKTSDAALPRLVAQIRALHPYDVPEIVALDPQWTLPEYAAWVESETSPGGSRDMSQKNGALAADERVGSGASPDPSRTGTRTGRIAMAAKKAKKAAKKTGTKKAAKKKK
jgi:periplasmic divalent cation tolerance protein